jgi:hypothetical protein
MKCRRSIGVGQLHETREERHGNCAAHRADEPRCVHELTECQHRRSTGRELRIHFVACVDDVQNRKEFAVRRHRQPEVSRSINAGLKQLDDFIDQQRPSGKNNARDNGVQRERGERNQLCGEREMA